MNKTVVITGGSSGIGKACAEIFAQNGFNVYELSRSGTDNGKIKHISADVTNAASINAAFEAVYEKEGSIDIVIANAGMGISGPVEFAPDNDIQKILSVNFTGAVNTAKSAVKYLRSSKGNLVFISSVAAHLAIPYQAFYSATKAAVLSLSDALRNELKTFGIKVCAVLPGDVQTGFTSNRIKNTQGDDIYIHADKAVSSMEKDEINGMRPEKVARVIYAAANKNNPKPHITVGGKYKFFVFLSKALPARLQNFIVGKMY